MAGKADAEEDIVQVLGEKYRIGVLDVVLGMLETAAFKAASLEERVQAEIAGLMLGFCGAMLSLSQPEHHAELRSVVIEHLPTYFDDARDGAGLERIGSSRPNLQEGSFLVQHRLQAVLGGLPVNDGLNELGHVAAVMLLTCCSTKEDAKRSAAMLGDQVRKSVLRNWANPDIAATRDERLKAARERMN